MSEACSEPLPSRSCVGLSAHRPVMGIKRDQHFSHFCDGVYAEAGPRAMGGDADGLDIQPDEAAMGDADIQFGGLREISTASAGQRAHSASSASVPMLPYSSSTTALSMTSPRQIHIPSPRRPRAYRRLVRSSYRRRRARRSDRRGSAGSKGASMPLTPTVSVWAFSISDAPPPLRADHCRSPSGDQDDVGAVPGSGLLHMDFQGRGIFVPKRAMKSAMSSFTGAAWREVGIHRVDGDEVGY